MRLRNCRSGLTAGALLLAAVPARADVMYSVDYSVTGVTFVCDQYLTFNCSVGGGGVTLFNNGGSLSFEPIPWTSFFIAHNTQPLSFPLLGFAATSNGPFATLPLGASNEALFSFTAALSFTTADGTQNASFTGGFYRDPGNTSGHIAIQGAQFTLPSGSLPAPFRVVAVVTSPPYPAFGTVGLSLGTVDGSASIIPEPSTIVLCASGLAVVGFMCLRRRLRSA